MHGRLRPFGTADIKAASHHLRGTHRNRLQSFTAQEALKMIAVHALWTGASSQKGLNYPGKHAKISSASSASSSHTAAGRHTRPTTLRRCTTSGSRLAAVLGYAIGWQLTDAQQRLLDDASAVLPPYYPYWSGMFTELAPPAARPGVQAL